MDDAHELIERLRAGEGAGADLTGARLVGAVFDNFSAHKASFRGADLTGARATFDGSFEEADFTDATAVGLEVTGRINAVAAVFVRARLTRARFDGIGLGLADFTGADLSGASLTGCRLHHAKLGGCDLTDADLTDVELYHADLATAVLDGATFLGARYDHATTWPDGPTPAAVFVADPDL